MIFAEIYRIHNEICLVNECMYIHYPSQCMLLFKVTQCNNIFFNISVGCLDIIEHKCTKLVITSVLLSSYRINTSMNYGQANIMKYTKHEFQCHQFQLSCSILIVNRGIVSPTLNVKPTLFVILCKEIGGLQIYSVAITITC